MLFVGYLCLIVGLWSFIHYLWTRRKYYILSYKMNSLLGLPFVGLLGQVKSPENILSYISWVRKPFTERNVLIWFGPRPFVYISEPDLMKKVLTSNNFLNKLDLYEIFSKHVGDGLISSRTPKWTHHRKQLEPAFGMTILKSFLPLFNSETEVLMQNLVKSVGTGEIDIMPFFQFCTLDITFQTTMGKRMNFQTEPNSEMVTCVFNLFNTTTARVLNPFIWNDFLFRFTNMRTLCVKYKLYLEKYVLELMERILLNNKKPDTEDSGKFIKKDNIFLERAVALWKSNQFTKDDVISEANTIISSSFDTTANTLSYTVMLLAMFPEYQERLYNELVTIFPQKDNNEIIYEDLPKLVYLERIISESMRLIAPVPLIGRTAAEEFQLTDDILLPKGTQLIIDIFNMHRDERIWGPKSQTFDPDHFAPEFKESGQYPCTYYPYAQGVRPCIGGRYAQMSIKVILAKVFRRFRFTTNYDFNNLKFMENVTMKLHDTPLVEVFERDK